MLNLGFTYEGMLRLWPLRQKELEGFPEAFRQGPAARAFENGDAEVRTGEPGDTGASAPDKWLFGRTEQPLHAVLSLYAHKGHEAAFERAKNAIGREAKRHGLQAVHRCEAASIDANLGFGYRDGLSEPRIAGRASKSDDRQPASSPGEFLLGEGYVDIYGGKSIGQLPRDIATNGSFCVVRLIEQRVDEFEKLLDKATSIPYDREFVAAKLMGRWRSGKPLSALSSSQAGVPDDDRNDFDYGPSHEYPGTPDDRDGLCCPLGAHIRRANPRSARVAGSRHSRRLIRRGMSWRDGEKQGLWGMFYCGSIERQFEFILREWINGGGAGGSRGSCDPIAGRGGKMRLPGMGRNGGELELDVPRLTITRGSAYLFVPGLKAIRSLDPQRARSQRHKVAGAAPDGWERTVEEAVDTALSSDAVKANWALGTKPLNVPRERQLPLRGVEFDPKDPDFIARPFQTYAGLRTSTPVCWMSPYQGYWVTRLESVRRMCEQPKIFRQKPPRPPARPAQAVGFFSMDGDRHADVGRALKQALDNATSGFEATAQADIDSVIDSLRGRPCFDLVGDFVLPVWRGVVLRILGVPEGDRAEVERLAHRVMRYNDKTLDLVQFAIGADSGIELIDTLGRLLVKSHAQVVAAGAFDDPDAFKGDVLQQFALRTDFTVPAVSGGVMSILEAGLTALQFVMGGMASEFLLATGARNLLLDHGKGRAWDELASLMQDPKAFDDLLATAIDECRRWDSPLQIIERYASQDVELDGVKIPAGAFVQGVLGSANRDGKGLDEFDIRRGPNGHLALLTGAHECLGKSWQGRLVPMALGSLIKARPTLRLQSPGATPPWIPNIYYRSFTALAVTDA